MKKFKKVLSFVAAFTMALAVAAPVAALADVTLKVKAPADWAEVYIHTWDVKVDGKDADALTNADVVSSWPGFQLTETDGDYKVITLKGVTAMNFLVGSGEGNPQTVDIKDLAEKAEGTYIIDDIKASEKEEDGGKFTYKLTAEDGTTVSTPATDANADNSPKTGDESSIIPVVAVGVVGVAALTVVLATRKKANA